MYRVLLLDKVRTLFTLLRLLKSLTLSSIPRFVRLPAVTSMEGEAIYRTVPMHVEQGTVAVVVKDPVPWQILGSLY